VATIHRLYLRRILPALVAVMFACPTAARGDRVDIDDPASLGSVLQSIDLNGEANDFERLITEVRYVSGMYSYIFAVQSSPYFPAAFGHSEGEAELVRFAVLGHALEGTWGAFVTRIRPGARWAHAAPRRFRAVPLIPCRV
jgi:hypothetical protein